MRLFLIAVTVALLSACTGETGDSSTSSSSSGNSGRGCNGHEDCEGGYVCKIGVCESSCNPNRGPIVNGCVVGAQCVSGACVLNTSCDENTLCAYDKGLVCRFSDHTCVDASETCNENSNPECASGYKCTVEVCHVDCEGTAGCANGKTCNGGTCQ